MKPLILEMIYLLIEDLYFFMKLHVYKNSINIRQTQIHLTLPFSAQKIDTNDDFVNHYHPGLSFGNATMFWYLVHKIFYSQENYIPNIFYVCE